MFLEQLKKSSDKIFKYIIFCAIFLGMMAMNIVSSSEVSTQEMIQVSIEQMGELLTFTTFLVPFVFLMIFLLIWVKLVHKQSIVSLITSRKKVDWNRVFFSFFLWAFVLIVMTSISYFFDPDSYTIQFDISRFIGLFVIALLFIPIQTSFEELFFRGYMMQGTFMIFGKRIISLLLTSIVFGLMHAGNPEVESLGPQIMVMYIGSGLFLGMLTLFDEGTELALGYHAANNLIGCLLLTSTESVFQTPSILRYNGVSDIGEIYLQVLVIFPILLVIFSRKFGFKISLKKLI